eukprot:TRINITY_DN68723_c0_g1_i1.p1 TRINITY_DN68723_c0_g1~~TRINITY_DN68723_c0_g1_i1.p1  ORF type:complete len:479 (-),score=44.87 TRINITY_DN68723_c0_g1_i1:70-1506(-)
MRVLMLGIKGYHGLINRRLTNEHEWFYKQVVFGNLMDFMRETFELVKEKKIEAIISHNDYADLIHAVCNEEFGFPGCTLKGTFLCSHKLYSQRILNESADPCFSVLLKTNSLAAESADVQPIPEQLTDFDWQTANKYGGAFLKAFLGHGAVGSTLVHNVEEAEKAVNFAWMSERKRRQNSVHELLNTKLLTTEALRNEFPLAMADGAVLEPLNRSPYSISIEAFLVGGKLTVWGIALTTQMEGCPLVILHDVMPSPKIPAGLQKRVLERFAKAAGIMYQNGFDKQFAGAEYGVSSLEDDAEIKWFEMNGRLAPAWGSAFWWLTGKCQIQCLLDVAQGKPPPVPEYTENSGVFIHVYVRTLDTGAVKDVVDIEYVKAIQQETNQIEAEEASAKKNDGEPPTKHRRTVPKRKVEIFTLKYRMDEPDTIVPPAENQISGQQLGNCNIWAPTYEEAEAFAHEVKQKMVKKPWKLVPPIGEPP